MTKVYLYLRRYLAVLFVLCSLTAWSQRTITGKVTSSDDGSSLPGVNVLVKGTSAGTATDAEGNFSISASDNAVLVFSFVGFKTQEVSVGAQSTVNVTLESDVTALSEVVVVGYGTVRVKDATGAVAAVSAEDFNGGLIGSPEQLIQGKTAGVQIVSTSGEPGAAVNFRIRGTNSIRSNNNPLFVVDGVPLAGGTQPAAGNVGFGTQQDANPLNFINPNDIESMSILKDASAAAIYGSRGANGVVIITTKSGKGGKGKLELSSSVSISSPANKYDLLDADEFLDAVDSYGTIPFDGGAKTDWQDYITRTSVSNTQNLSYSKGFSTGAIRATLGYDNQNGVLEHSSMTRVTGRINGNKTFLDNKLNLELTSTYSNVKREDPPITSSAGFQGDLMGAAYSANPTWPTDPDYNSGGQRSPANMLEYFSSTGTTNRLLANLSASYKVTNELTAKVTYGLDWAKGDRLVLITGDAINAGNGVADRGQGQLNENKNVNNLIEATLAYNKKIGIVNIEAVGGYSFQSFHNKWFWATGKGFSNYSSFNRMEEDLRSSFAAGNEYASQVYGFVQNWGVSPDLRRSPAPPITNGMFVSTISSGELAQTFMPRGAGLVVDAMTANFNDQTDYLQSYFGRGNFTISDKYILTATLRVDGSSKFGGNNKYGVFPSGAVAWKMHEEAFMPEVFSNLKLRAGYGIVGNQDGLGYGEFIRRDRWSNPTIGDGVEVTVPGIETVGSVNPNLKWEETTTIGAGFDFGIFNEKLTGSFDVYSKSTTDLLIKGFYPQPAPVTFFFLNLPAKVTNKGWELSLSYLVLDKPDVSFTVSGNVSHNENMVEDYGGLLQAGTIYGQGLTGAFAQMLTGGQPLFSYYLREFGGFDETTGQPIGDVQKFVGKSALPTWVMGLSLNGRYKAFDMSMYFSGQFGHYIYNNTANAFFTAGSINNNRNVTRDVIGNGEAGSAEASVSTRFLESGNFIRMQNITVGYTVPLNDMKFISKLRFYATGQNLFVITDYSGLDPEVSSSPASGDLLNGLPTAGIDYAAYPRPRTFTIGLNATF